MAELLKGAPVARALMEGLSGRVSALAAAGVTPTLAVVRVGERPDDLAYERAATRRCEGAGIAVRSCALAAGCTQDELEGLLARLSADASVHGVLLLRPLPAPLDELAAARALAPEKDVDGITEGSLCSVLSGRGGGFAPCTAEAVVALLDHYGVGLSGAEACVVGRSLVIGRPASALLLARDATVTTCHTRTRDLAACCRRADVLVAAAGSPRRIGRDCVREGQVVVDVGTTWDEEAGALVGDVDLAAVEGVVGRVTPVPGGVGSVTTAVLAEHVVEAAERRARVR